MTNGNNQGHTGYFAYQGPKKPSLPDDVEIDFATVEVWAGKLDNDLLGNDDALHCNLIAAMLRKLRRELTLREMQVEALQREKSPVGIRMTKEEFDLLVERINQCGDTWLSRLANSK